MSEVGYMAHRQKMLHTPDLNDHIPAIDSMRTTVFGGPLGSGDSRIKKVGGPLRGQGKSRGANKVIYCICIGPTSTK